MAPLGGLFSLIVIPNGTALFPTCHPERSAEGRAVEGREIILSLSQGNST